MEGKEEIQGSGVVARDENPNQFSGPTVVAPPATMVAPPATMVAPPAPPATMVAPGTVVKKKRGRPRKYGPDGKLTMALSPMPISVSIPVTGDFSGWKHSSGQPVDLFKKKQKLKSESPGERLAYSVGANFTPHVITVNAGEDVNMKIISFSQQGSRAICILAANGPISIVTLRQPTSSGGTLTYEGRFEILSLSGSFMSTDNGGTKSRCGGMSVSLAGSDGRVFGGGLAGLLVAAGPVQVVVGSFLPGHQQEQKPKKQRFEPVAAFSLIPTSPIFGEGTERAYIEPKPNFTPANSMHGLKSLNTENHISVPVSESNELKQTKCEVSC